MTDTFASFTPDPELGAAVRADDRAHVFHSWSAQDLIDPLPIAGSSGSWVWDYDGNRYLDLTSQLVYVNIGHGHPAVVDAIKKQAEQLATVAPQYATQPTATAAKLIAEVAPEGLDHVFFTNGGADANENAIRMARLHTGRHKVLSLYRSYHGATTTAIATTGDSRRWPNETGVSGHVHFNGPFLYRSAFWATTEQEECARALEHLEQTIAFEGPGQIAAIVLESVPGTAGVMPPPPGYLAGVRALADKYGIVYIADEVMSGFGRTGSWFAVDHYDVVPDLITFAKGVTSGYVPLGGVIINGAIRETFGKRSFPGGLTYSGHPLACAAAVATITAMHDEKVVENADRIGREVFGPGLAALAAKHPSVGDVRGLGVFWALDLVRDPATRQPIVPANAAGADNAPIAELGAACKKLGMLPFLTANRLHVVPPCTITDEEANLAIDKLDEALAVADRHVG